MSKKRMGRKKAPRPPKKLAPGVKDTYKRNKQVSTRRESKPLGKDGSKEKESQPISVPGSSIGPRGRGDSGGLLTDPHHVRSDLSLIEQSVKKGWNVRRKTMIRRRLEEIVEKKLADVVTKEGIVQLESKADELAIKATSILVQMDTQDQTRLKNSSPQPTESSTTVNVNVNNLNVSDPDERRRVELARLALKFGARELVIDGQSISCSDIVGTASEVQEDPEVT
jgi:hypothetical protein